ncbi:MAG: hypothetical protein AAF743_03270 [Planctomycetota bacterium]
MPEGFDESDIPFGDDLEPADPDRPDWDDGFQPPEEPTEVGCLHCGEVFESYMMVRRPIDGMEGEHWCCPTPGCTGIGFGFDIFPTDPDWVDPEGRLQIIHDDDEEDGEFDDEEFEDEPADWWKNGGTPEFDGASDDDGPEFEDTLPF